MCDSTTLAHWTQTTHPDGTIRLVRRLRPQDRLRRLGVSLGGIYLVCVAGQFIWGNILLTQLAREAQGISVWLPRLGLLVVCALFVLRLIVGGGRPLAGLGSVLQSHEVILIRENFLEHRVVLGRWRRATRITEGWVYLERTPGESQPQTYQIRVRGKGGEVVLARETVYDPSFFVDTPEVPLPVAQLAQFLSHTTEWPLDVPYLLRRGSQIRTV